ncbi:MAG: hypothetical protein ACYCRE_01975 [Acidobacteriaceae bacterium]
MATQKRSFKMEWAKIHLDTLNAHYESVVSQPKKIYSITVEEYPRWGLLEIKSECIGAIEFIKLGLIAADYISNLRSSLDHLVWKLAAIGNSARSSDISFPVCFKDSPRTQANILAATLGMPKEAIALVKSLQPYHSGKAYKSNHLWRLNFLWNASKHRILAIHTAESGVLYEVPPGVRVEERKFDDYAVVTIPLSAKDKVRLNPRPNIEITFGDEERGVRLTIQDLRDIYEFVSSQVVPSLLGFLP